MKLYPTFKIGASLIVFILFFSTLSYGQFRVVGYIHAGREIPDLNKVSIHKLTHLNIAFVNPDSAGNLVLPRGFDTIIKTAHGFSVKVLASIGGGSHNPNYSSLLNDNNRTAFVQKLIQLSLEHNLDGIDVDLENDAIDNNYAKLITDLSGQLKPLGKLLTAAYATWNAEKIKDSALNRIDFLNIMSYDQTGPWRPDKPGPHSTYKKAVEDLEYWTVIRKIPKNKVNLGLPFYGYCFGTQYGESMSYGDILRNFPGSEKQDMIAPQSGGMIYYNGLPTINKKVELAKNKAGGVMIWQILQDDPGKLSLLSAILHKIQQMERRGF